MEYNLKEHGDHLERNYSDFIRKYFNNYEDVWKIFIGNKGNDTKAEIVGISIDLDTKRQNFSEHTYTILQSLILIHRLIEKREFTKTISNTTEDILDLQNNLLLFFTHLGRINDNVESVTHIIDLKSSETTELLKEFYHQRHILVHGKMVPIIFKQNGEILLPELSKNGTDITGWYHKEHSWKDINKLPKSELEQTATKLYFELISKLNEIFGVFKKKIENDLKFKGLQIKFEQENYPEIHRHGSGSFHNSPGKPISVYGLDKIDIKKWGK